MKKQLCFVALGVLALLPACGKKSGSTTSPVAGPLWRHHFVGAAPLANNTNAAVLLQVWSLPSTQPFLSETLDKIARAPHRLWRQKLAPGAPDGAALIRPLLNDLVTAESFSEVEGSTNRPDVVVALRLSDDRARLWETNLWQLVEAWKMGTPRGVAAGKFQGWELRFGGGSNLIQIVRGDGWTVLGAGTAPLAGLPRLLGKLGRNEKLAFRGPEPWLSVQADLPRLGTWLPLFRTYRLAPLDLTIRGHGENLRTYGTLTFPRHLEWSFEPWRIPTNRIDESIISFTVAQGLAPVLAEIKAFKSLGLAKMPNQICIWGLPTIHSQTSATIPVDDATNTIRRIAGTLPAAVGSLLGQELGTFLYASNTAAIFWQGFPFISPYARPYQEVGQEYLLAGMLPLPGGTNPPPAGLFEQLKDRKDLAYYDWEITEGRVVHAKQMHKLLDLMNGRQTTPEAAPSQAWLSAVAPLLGNTATEITVHLPHELKLVRKSPIGLTGIELVTLVDWIESPGFPLTYDPMPRLTGPPPGTKPLQIQP